MYHAPHEEYKKFLAARDGKDKEDDKVCNLLQSRPAIFSRTPSRPLFAVDFGLVRLIAKPNGMGSHVQASCQPPVLATGVS